MLHLENICKSYTYGGQSATVLENVNLKISAGEIVAIRGKSGSGKSTLLNILSASLMADSGRMIFKGKDMQSATHRERAKYRSTTIGYIPQGLYLLEDRDVFKNIALPLQYMGMKKADIKKKIEILSFELGIKSLLDKDIRTLSGGERQRVAICRAIIKHPKILFADEPTNSLDNMNEALILDIFKRMKKQGAAIVVATHDDAVSNICDITYKIA